MTYDLSVAINDVRLTTIGKCLSCNEGLVYNLKIMWLSSDCHGYQWRDQDQFLWLRRTQERCIYTLFKKFRRTVLRRTVLRRSVLRRSVLYHVDHRARELGEEWRQKVIDEMGPLMRTSQLVTSVLKRLWKSRWGEVEEESHQSYL